MKGYLSALLALCWLVLGGMVQAQGQYVTYLHPDIQGSPLVATDEQGAMQWHEDYEPWGARQVKEANSVGNGRGSKVWYTGKEEEAGLGLYYYGARWYAPDVGQFYSTDPAAVTLDNPRSFNRYAYANNNPIVYIDPDGRDAVGIKFKGYQVETGYGFKIPAGHAGVLLIDPAGKTKYYEYGRYGPNGPGVMGEGLAQEDGNIRNVKVSDVKMGKDGKPTKESLEKVYAELSARAGKNNPVEAEYHDGADFGVMQSYVKQEANNKDRAKYSLLGGNTCYGFRDRVIDAGMKKAAE